MENYFQAEAYNLDKVLDEFEQNEDETVSPPLLDTKWNQILDPPSHRPPLSVALADVDEPAVPNEPQQRRKARSLAHPAPPTPGRGERCANGGESSVSPEPPVMWIDDRAPAEDQPIKRSGDRGDRGDRHRAGDRGDTKCGTRGRGPEDKNVLVVAVLHNCDQRTRESTDLLAWNSGHSPTPTDAGGLAADDEARPGGLVRGAGNGPAGGAPDPEGPRSWPGTEDTLDDRSDRTRPEGLPAACFLSRLKDLGDSGDRDPAFSSSSNAGATALPMRAGDGPTVPQQESRPPAEADPGPAGSPGTRPDPPEDSPHSGEGHTVRAESSEDGPAGGSPRSGAPPLPEADQSVGSGGDGVSGRRPHGSARGEAGADGREAAVGCPEPPCPTDRAPSLQGGNGGELSPGHEPESPPDNAGTEGPPGSGCQPRGPCGTREEGAKGPVAAGELEFHGTRAHGFEDEGLSAAPALPAACPPLDPGDPPRPQSPGGAGIPKTLPSKEDSVTEEKEIEESKSECYAGVFEQRGPEAPEGNGLVSNSPGDQGKKNYFEKLGEQADVGPPGPSPPRLPASSAPFGGARPKHPTNLKLQIPKSPSDPGRHDLAPPGGGAGSKNKNDASGKTQPGVQAAAAADGFPDGVPPASDGELSEDGEAGLPGSVGPAAGPDDPDNDLRASRGGAPARRPLTSLGEVAPVWVPDSHAPNCMKCEARFTFTKRRHHCRACGKVFCAACCSLKCKLLYLDRKEARVCVICHSVLMNVAQPREQRRVWFADGILPNGEVADAAKLTVSGTPSAGTLAVAHDLTKPVTDSAVSAEADISTFSGSITQVGSPVGSAMNLIPEDGLPPILISTGVKGDYAVEERPSQISVMQQLEDGGPDPLVFVLNANLLSMVKMVNYVNRRCWCFTTKGMHAVGQSEIVILLQCLPDEKCLPKDVFTHFVQLYRDALAGSIVGSLGHSFFSQSFLGSKEHGGFLYVTATYQSLQDLVLPTPPYLFGILIQKWETPWAKVFPIRLMLRLGAEYRLYPCPLFSVRFRKPLFGETGHTIMNLLADFRNYQYTLPGVQGLVVDMEVRKTSIKIPSNRYNEMMKVMSKSNEHVLAGGACFNEKADSHLVCVQNDDGNYQTQAISIHNQPRMVTGASFFVFSGALKASSGYLAKSSIVEDGVMVQITAENMESLRQALREMKDFTITCGKAGAEDPQEHIHVQWVADDKNVNKGVVSPIDGKAMESITSVKIFHGSEYRANGKVIRWTEVFFLENDDQHSGLSDPADHSRLTEHVAKAFCLALCPHLKLLKEDGMTKLGLRVTLDADQVGYQAGSNGQPLPSPYMKDLDSALVPVIHGGACQLSEGPLVMELQFFILESIS
ncbi:zinc finger FYVE domain-containing protein 9 isoform X2 [Tachyglossus aculeatus]|uniref:zinc finger FYVE domain-containing protein 9 isoform X2 n=1 Tax=Tachyglossus aculeatus TaxID=9261 RepID=UPI0018F6468D|nr:zinc finger FYVE domain-containing protein 9 isoform X2 [Tachyglossus aculeatus]